VAESNPVTEPDLRSNPDADPAAPGPSIGRYPVNGTTVYAEVRGAGAALLLIHGGAEDAEMWRPVAERLATAGRTVVTYDRRGTLRSGRQDWPGGGSAQHADDAAGLLREIGIGPAIVFGGSSAGIVATQLALRYPTLVRRALIFEPGYLRCVPGGTELQKAAHDAVVAHLDRHAADWVGAYAACLAAAVQSAAPGQPGFLAPPTGKDWFSRREEGNAEAFVRDDIPLLTAEVIDEASLALVEVDLRISHGTASPPVFREIASHLAAVRGGKPDVIAGAGHAIYFQADLVADYIRSHGGA
jgi:pimeloyl-ACP methyl ester carboxylesterase